MQKFGRLLNRYNMEPEVSDAINTLLQKKIVEYDEDTNTLTVNMDIKIKFNGRLDIDCKEHILMNSGQGLDPTRDDNVPYSIWFNSEVDDDGNPIVEK